MRMILSLVTTCYVMSYAWKCDPSVDFELSNSVVDFEVGVSFVPFQMVSTSEFKIFMKLLVTTELLFI